MKNFILSFTAIAVMGTVLASGTVATAQSGTRTAQASKPHKIGLVDMAFIFKNYKRFKAEREQIEEELKRAAETAKTQRDSIQKMQETLKQMEPTSPQFSQKEKELASTLAAFQADASALKRQLVMKEAELYKKTYLEVTDIIGKYAKAYNFTLILRYSQETVAADDTPQEVMQKMGRQVVFRDAEYDITQAVLDYMNKAYEGESASRGTGTRR